MCDRQRINGAFDKKLQPIVVAFFGSLHSFLVKTTPVFVVLIQFSIIPHSRKKRNYSQQFTAFFAGAAAPFCWWLLAPPVPL